MTPLTRQIVEIRPSDKPGSFTVFAMTGPGDMQVIVFVPPLVLHSGLLVLHCVFHFFRIYRSKVIAVYKRDAKSYRFIE